MIGSSMVSHMPEIQKIKKKKKTIKTSFFRLVGSKQFPAGISIDLLVWLSCRVSYINNNMISG